MVILGTEGCGGTARLGRVAKAGADMKAVVTGAAGFIGSQLSSHLADKGWDVTGIDLHSPNAVGTRRSLLRQVHYVKGDLRREGSWRAALYETDVVYHFAADPDVRTSTDNPRSHFANNITATWNVLEAMRHANVRFLVFASSSTVLGEPSVFPTPEDYAPLFPISVYGAAKLACEDIIKGHTSAFGMKSLIVRPANVVGPHLTHGVILDFVRKLIRNPKTLEVLGDGGQKKSYVHTKDFIDALDILSEAFMSSERRCDVYNIGNEDCTSVTDVADIVTGEMDLNPEIRFLRRFEDGRAWVGDVRKVFLDISKLRSLGWQPQLTSNQAVRSATRSLLQGIDSRRKLG